MEKPTAHNVEKADQMLKKLREKHAKREEEQVPLLLTEALTKGMIEALKNFSANEVDGLAVKDVTRAIFASTMYIVLGMVAESTMAIINEGLIGQDEFLEACTGASKHALEKLTSEINRLINDDEAMVSSIKLRLLTMKKSGE